MRLPDFRGARSVGTVANSQPPQPTHALMCQLASVAVLPPLSEAAVLALRQAGRDYVGLLTDSSLQCGRQGHALQEAGSRNALPLLLAFSPSSPFILYLSHSAPLYYNHLTRKRVGIRAGTFTVVALQALWLMLDYPTRYTYLCNLKPRGHVGLRLILPSAGRASARTKANLYLPPPPFNC